MYPSSTLCRAQEEFHRARADAATLENVRIIAAGAAMAWGVEAVAAEKREARGLRTRALADEIAAQKAADALAAGVNENPDRALAAA